MTHRNVRYPQVLRDSAKAENKQLVTLDVPGMNYQGSVTMKDADLLVDKFNEWNAERKGKEPTKAELVELLQSLTCSHENYMAHSKPERDWDEYDYMMFPRWKLANDLLKQFEKGEPDGV